MLETYRVQIRFPLYGGDDQTATNTLYFRGNDPLNTESDDITEILDRIQAFLGGVDTVLAAGAYGTTTTPVIVIYRMSDAPPRLPIYEDPDGTYTVGSGVAYPSDVAIVLSFRGEYTSGTPRGRKRGRIYLGPVVASAGGAITNQGIRIQSGTVTQILAAAQLLATQVQTSLLWVQWSEVAGTWSTIVEIWVDNQFDTRRSRDRQTVTRTQQAVVQ